MFIVRACSGVKFDVCGIEFVITYLSYKSDILLKGRGSETNFGRRKTSVFEECSWAVTRLFWIYVFVRNGVFSHGNDKNRATLYDDHSEQCLRLAVSNYSPDYDRMQCHTSTMPGSTK